MTFIHAVTLVTFMALCLAAGLASAQGRSDVKVPGGISTQAAQAFRTMDTNGDGYISRVEAGKDPRTTKFFGQADRDGDGKLDMAEFKLALPTGFTDPYLGE
jgi:hypothetical protein